MRGVEGQIVGIVQLLHVWDLRKLNKHCLSLTSAGKEEYDGAWRTGGSRKNLNLYLQSIWGKRGKPKMIHMNLNRIH